MADRPGSWVRDHLANERTLLAWIRTSLAFMAFGMGIAKLGLLLAISAYEHPDVAASLPDWKLSQWAGAGMVAIGGVLALLGGIQTRRWSREIPGDPPRTHVLILTVAVAVLTSAGLLVYLLVSHPPW
jgi:putative membrane protein